MRGEGEENGMESGTRGQLSRLLLDNFSSFRKIDFRDPCGRPRVGEMIMLRPQMDIVAAGRASCGDSGL